MIRGRLSITPTAISVGVVEDGACRFQQPRTFQHYQPQYAYPQYYEAPPQPDSSSEKDELKNILESMLQDFTTKSDSFSEKMKKMSEETRELNSDIARLANRCEKLSFTWNSDVTPEPEIEALHTVTSSCPAEPEIVTSAPPPQEEAPYIPHCLPAVLEMQKNLRAKQEKEQRERAAQVNEVEEVPESKEEYKIQEPVLLLDAYEDSDSESDWGEPVHHMVPHINLNSWHDWEDIDIEHLWCADEETDAANVSVKIDESKGGAPTQLVEDLSISYVTQVCDELEKLLYEESDTKAEHGHTAVEPLEIVQEVRIL